ncbi:unnamed protein product [Blepharisma stoltei]|uniref:Uncharacterized protein n=1 Tax=Blepharisma stoltei TaxID=1481888 RepID=A0AAU9K1S9_9CILI|nr:unnamed protein product [Blepharisma stoltei]
MDKAIQILDFIDANELEWINLRRELKEEMFGGLSELANFNLTREGVGLDISTLIEDESTVNVDFSGDRVRIIENPQPKLAFPYNQPPIAKAKRRFQNVLQKAADLILLRQKLNTILLEN